MTIIESIDLMSAKTALLPQWYGEFSSECVSRLHVPVDSVPLIAKLIRGVVTSLDGVTPRHRDQVIALYHEFVEKFTPLGDHN
jgi:hypothetical protein